MNRRILTLCKYLVATSTLFATAPAFSGVNDHPAFKFKSNKELANLKPTSKSQTPLSRVDQKPSVDELHYEEKHPHQDATLVDTASIDTSKLIPSKVISLDPNRPDLELPDPQITIAGKSYILSVVESIPDVKERIRYVTAKIVGHKGRARFVIDDASKEIVGNLMIDGETYRVLPRGLNKGQQLIYQLKDHHVEKHQKKYRFLARSAHRSASRLENLLLKSDLLSQIRPVIYRDTHKDTGGRTTMTGGNIGHVKISKLLEKDVNELTVLLNNLEPLTKSSGNISYKIISVGGSEKRGFYIKFRQTINDIPLDRNSTIKFDSKGVIKEISVAILQPERIDINSSKFTELEILKIAKSALGRYLKESDLKFTTLPNNPINLVYKVTGTNHTIRPYWEVVLYEVAEGLGSYRVIVDGNSGEVKISPANVDITNQFQTDVCEHESGLSLPTCEDVNIFIPGLPPIFGRSLAIITESAVGQAICNFFSLCNDPQAKHPWEVINNLEDWLSEETAGICCEDVGGVSGSIDVKINTDNNGPAFHPNGSGGGTILFPHPSDLDPNTYNPVQTQKFDDIVVHEASHGIFRGDNSGIEPALKDNDPLALAMDEGFSDAMAVLYSEKFNPPGSTKVGVGVLKNPSHVRDISEPKSLDDFIDGSSPGLEHQNGKIFGNFIFRARQAGLSVDQAAEAILLIVERTKRDDGLIDDKLDQKDIKDALDEISLLDQVIGAILQTVWEQMNGYEDPPAGGGGPGSPLAPSFVTGFFTGCYETVSLYSNSWGSSSGASYYQVFYSPTGGGYIYSFSTSFPGATTANTINAYVKVKACNSSGCSPLSASTFFQPHLCGG